MHSSGQNSVLVFLGVLFTIVLAGLDNTIVSTVIPVALPELEYRTCATSSRAAAKVAVERMIGRRETYMSGAA